MAWELKIHHIDVGQGDATLIVVREVLPLIGGDAIIRSALIDGGEFNKGLTVDEYIRNQHNLGQLDIMIATHYDKDHYYGLRHLLLTANFYDKTIIFDQGEQGTVVVKRLGDGSFKTTIGNREDPYIRYLNAINARGRITQNVKNCPVSIIEGQAGWENPDWLVNREVLWHGLNGGVPAGAPTMTCIAANQYIRGAGDANPVVSGAAVDPKNEKSLAFLLQFNNFKYYIGGDIETAQENHIMNDLNAADNDAGRILAMKVSHHGSDRSTSAAFVNRLRPSAAFISCGYNNSFQHPRAVVLNNLQNCANLQHYYLTTDRDDATFNTRVGRVGDAAPDLAGAYTAKAIVAGSWGPPYDEAPAQQYGNIVLTVTQTQSMFPPNGALLIGQSRFTVTGYSADSIVHGPFNNAHQ